MRISIALVAEFVNTERDDGVPHIKSAKDNETIFLVEPNGLLLIVRCLKHNLRISTVPSEGDGASKKLLPNT